MPAASSRPSTVTFSEDDMRMLMNVSLPHEPFNRAVREGTAGEKLGRILEEIRPEAVYFTEREGRRGAVLIVDVAEPSRIPSLAEPFFLLFDADVEFHVVMTQDDLGRSELESLGRRWGG